MHTLKEIKILLQKELMIELRQKTAFLGIILYVLSTCFVAYFSFKVVQPLAWIALFWVMVLFATINAISRSFMQYSKGQTLYFYTIVSAEAIVLSKIIYNSLLNLVVSAVALVCFSVLVGNPIKNMPVFFIAMCLGSVSLSTSLTMMSAIAHKAGNNHTLMTILGLPVVIPTLSMVIKISKNALDGLQFVASIDEITALSAITIIALAVAYLLFPYLWQV